MNAFWSLTMYDGKTQFLIENPISRYLINSPMLPDMKKNADGSLTLYIQNKSPGADKESNWLPAPNDTIYGAAALLAEDNAAVDPATRRRNVAAARREESSHSPPEDRAAHTSTRPLLARFDRRNASPVWSLLG